MGITWFTNITISTLQTLTVITNLDYQKPNSICKFTVRNLKFATYLKFATCGNTNKNNKIEVRFVECIINQRLFEWKYTKFKTKRHFLHRIN